MGKECNLCPSEQLKDEKVGKHHRSKHTLDQIFLSHHEEVNKEEEDELLSDLWNTLLVDDDDSGLTEAEEKEVLKLNKYFAH